MINNFSYNRLEQKIQNLKSNLDNLCSILDQCRESTKPLPITNDSLEDLSSVHSQDSYYTARDRLSFSSSFSSYESCFDQLEFVEPIHENYVEESKTESLDTLSKKIVSFSQYVTVLEVYNKKNKRIRRKEQIINLKEKFVDYIYREKFYIKYKWQKVKHNILKSNKKSKNKQKIETNNHNDKEKSTLDEENKTDTIDLKSFFQEIFENSLLETDLDHNSVAFVKDFYTVPLTDLNSIPIPKESMTCNYSDKAQVMPETRNSTNIDNRIRIQPKLFPQCNSVQKSNSIENNLLLQYLISKAHYPIQLKIATSVLKLNLPVWYQSSLIL